MEFNDSKICLVNTLTDPIVKAKISKKAIVNNPIFDKLIELSHQTNQIHSLYLELFSDEPSLNLSNITNSNNNDDKLKIFNYLKCEQCDWKLVPQNNQSSKKQTKIESKELSKKEKLINSRKKTEKENTTEDKKYYSCTLCEKLYKSKENLNLHHMNIHLNLKPYKCKICDKRFSHRNGKIYHEKNRH